MLLHWYGHSCFLLYTERTSIMTDPFNEKVGYPLPEDLPSYITVSHEHYDHSAVGLIHGTPVVKRNLVPETLGDIHVYGVNSFHDADKGASRGKNTIFVFEHNGVRICHLGDLGHALNDTQVAAIGAVDVLLIPVGGVYTIEGESACTVVHQLRPNVIIPMHFKTRDLSFHLGDVHGFCTAFRNVVQSGQCTLNITKETLPKTQQVIIMEYCHKA